ncbi:hypothetical protein Mgra_00007313 [Meloidogyne graminicola]|uniref:Uncharacterized protein n=1 Tax=Meloidogyne graminicola TaxID=189291 RepID=A0A8S9ZIU4_9BILA|nr:hypothetical protein Mgra_00007313 [Meloidogyne graminicola]
MNFQFIKLFIFIIIFIFLINLINTAPQIDFMNGQRMGAHGTGMGQSIYHDLSFWRFFK